VAQVNRLIRDCADGEHIFYAEIGKVLLDRDGLLPAAISPDQLHFTELGYARLAARLDPELDRLLGPSRQRIRALICACDPGGVDADDSAHRSYRVQMQMTR
jgi:hypothetical protein